MIEKIITTVLWKLIEWLLNKGSDKVKDAIAKSKAHSRIDKEVKELEEVVDSNFKNSKRDLEKIKTAARNLIRAHNS